jgi:hypothetical protein
MVCQNSKCGKEFESHRFGQLYCSLVCTRRQKDRRTRKSPSGLLGFKRRRSKRLEGLKSLVQEIKQKAGCVSCPENHPACLGFHHRVPEEKLFTIAHAISHGGIGKEALLAETAKCDVICANCHKKHHWDHPVSTAIIREGRARP